MSVNWFEAGSQVALIRKFPPAYPTPINTHPALGESQDGKLYGRVGQTLSLLTRNKKGKGRLRETNTQCGTCKKTYIGQTGRTLKHRVKEHRRALISHNANFSAVAEHAMRENHESHGMKQELFMATISGYKDVIWKDGTSD